MAQNLWWELFETAGAVEAFLIYQTATEEDTKEQTESKNDEGVQ